MYEPEVFEEDLLIPPGEDVALPPALEQALNYIQATEYSQEDNTEVVQPIIEDVEDDEDDDDDDDEEEDDLRRRRRTRIIRRTVHIALTPLLALYYLRAIGNI